MEKINVAELLKDCPKGMELDCYLFNRFEFDHIDTDNENYPIVCRAKTLDGEYNIHTFTKYGWYSASFDYSKCVIFPKGKTTWEGFQRPFKDGDIIFTRTSDDTWVSIFNQFSENSCCTYIDLYIDGNDLFIDTRCLCCIEEIITQRLATEEEKQILFQAIKDNGYKWSEETKTLEDLIEEPKFKVGDRIKHKTHISQVNVVTEIKDTHYILDDELALPFIFQDEYELVPDKFDINTLVSFESRVLVRDNKLQKWSPAIWGFYDSDSQDYQYKLVGVIARYCIPYEGNEHLLGKTDDCDEYFKTWK